jgi:Tol biopolymer transport system component
MKFAKVLKFLLSPAIATILSSCTIYPRMLNFPFDAGGRGLNSQFDELSPQVAGRYIVFASDRLGRQDIYLFDGLSRRLVDLPGLNSLDAIASDPGVSQDGRYIVFTRIQQDNTDIYFYDRETRQLRNVTANLAAQVRHPTISADGSTIAFESSANGQWDILVYDQSGKPLNVPMDPR